MLPRITPFQTRNKTSGIAVPRTMAVLKNKKLMMYITYEVLNRPYKIEITNTSSRA